MGLFYPIRIFFHSLKFENAVLFSPKDPHRNCDGRTCLQKECLSPRPLPRAFSEFITYQIAMENDEIKYKSREN